MLKAFCDESAENDGLFVMAGYVAPVENWERFIPDWQAALDYKDRRQQPLPYFKMSARTSRRGMERAEKFYRVIENHVIGAFSVRLNRPDVSKALKRAKWPQELIDIHVFRSTYYIAFRMVIEGLAQVQHHLGIREPVDFIFDEHTSKIHCLAAWENLKTRAPQEWAYQLGDTPIFRDEKTLLPLQAADLYAWWVRKWAKDGIEDGVQNQRFDWRPSRYIDCLEYSMAEDGLVKNFADELELLKGVFPGDAGFLSSAGG